MSIAGPDDVDAAIKTDIDLDGSPIPGAMLALYNQVMDLESQRARSGVLKSLRNRLSSSEPSISTRRRSIRGSKRPDGMV